MVNFAIFFRSVTAMLVKPSLAVGGSGPRLVVEVAPVPLLVVNRGAQVEPGMVLGLLVGPMEATNQPRDPLGFLVMVPGRQVAQVKPVEVIVSLVVASGRHMTLVKMVGHRLFLEVEGMVDHTLAWEVVELEVHTLVLVVEEAEGHKLVWEVEGAVVRMWALVAEEMGVHMQALEVKEMGAHM